MKRLHKLFTPVLLVVFTAIIFSCNNGGEKKEAEQKPTDSTATAFTPFKLMMIKHPVANFAKWKEGYLAHDSMRLSFGISQYVIGRGLEDSNMVIVMDKIADFQKAKDFTSQPELKMAMQKAGVTGVPEISLVDVIRNDDTKIDQKERIMITHKVKDFATWLKAYDEEGKATRAANGMLDRGLARGIEDSNMVYIVFAITDMEKAKARFNSEDLKKIMTTAGVISAPQTFIYNRVD